MFSCQLCTKEKTEIRAVNWCLTRQNHGSAPHPVRCSGRPHPGRCSRPGRRGAGSGRGHTARAPPCPGHSCPLLRPSPAFPQDEPAPGRTRGPPGEPRGPGCSPRASASLSKCPSASQRWGLTNQTSHKSQAIDSPLVLFNVSCFPCLLKEPGWQLQSAKPQKRPSVSSRRANLVSAPVSIYRHLLFERFINIH